MKKLLFLIPFLCISALKAEPQISQEFNFSGGVNYSLLETDIDPKQSPDMCNCISDPIGSATPRRGTERLFSQAVSTYPVTSIYKIYSETSTEKSLLFINKNTLYISTGGIVPVVFKGTDSLKEYSGFNWLQMQNKAILLGGFDNNIKEVDPITNHVKDLFSDFSTAPAKVYLRAKHGVVFKNYMLLGNVLVSTSSKFETNISTIYPSRIYFSDLNSRSSFTAFNFIDFASGDGGEITGAGSIYDTVNFFKPSKILEINYSVLDFTASGDVSVGEIVNDFGLRAPKSLVGARLYYAFAADDGIRLWNGSRQSRLTPSDESRVISKDIDVLIKRLIKANTYKNSIMQYYPKREWLVFAYEDPGKFPKNAANSIMIYDFNLLQWFPLCGLTPQSMFALSGSGDYNQIVIGDNDGYVFEFDKKERSNDMRRDMPVDVMDNQALWVGSSQNLSQVKTGTASLKMSISSLVTQSSMTRMAPFNFGEWQDKSKITRNDKFKFLAYVDGLQNLSSLRVDLEVNVLGSAFDTNFTSVTLSSSAFIGGNNGWSEFEIALSSFPIRPDWTSFDSETLPFANTLFFYGIRFVANGVETSTVSIDDIRIVQGTNENPINFYRTTKLFDLQTKAEKNFGGMLLTLDKPDTTNLDIDIFNNFGIRSRTQNLPADFPKEIISVGYTTGTIAVLDSIDYSVKRSSALSSEFSQYFQGTANKDYFFLSDRNNDAIRKFKREDFVQVSSFGSLGSGSTNFNLIHQISANKDQMFIVDQVNQKIKVYDLSKNSFIREIGGLGTSTNTATPKFHQPTAIAANDTTAFVADEGNYRWMRFNISTMAFELQETVDYNTVGETSFALDSKYLYAVYMTGSEANLTDSDIILEKRNINDLSLVDRAIVRPKTPSSTSIYGHTGDIAIVGKYIYIVFNDDDDDVYAANYYIQKRLKDDLSLVSEKKFPGQRMFSILGNSLSYKPDVKTKLVDLRSDGRYVQLKFYGNSLDNDVTLYNMTFLVDVKSQGY